MSKFRDITEERFYRLVAIRPLRLAKNKRYVWLFHCDCGNNIEREASQITCGDTKSCGCFRREFSSQKSFRHGFTQKGKTQNFYSKFAGIKQRCTDQKVDSFQYYGRRGIKCLWNSFENFRDDMYRSYQLHVKKFGEKNTTIDRINNNGHYCKENCRWATYKEQANNKRNNFFLLFEGKKKTIDDWSKIVGMKKATLWERIKRGWSAEKTLQTKVRKWNKR